MRHFFVLLITCVLLCALTACGGVPEESLAPEDSVPEAPAELEEADETVYDCGGIEIALPKEYLDLLIVDTDSQSGEEDWKPLVSVYEKASVEAAEEAWGDPMGSGFLFGVLAMNQAGYEQFLCGMPTGVEVVARDGAWYYAWCYPTDVRFYRPGGIDQESGDWKTWESLCRIGEDVIADTIRRNGLIPCDGLEFFSRSYTWEGDHAYFQYRFPGEYDQESRYVLVLSQPVRQGAGGIWCLDRWMYEGANPMAYFPDSGLPAAEYYAQLQAACDSGEQSELLTPAGAAAAFIREYFGTEPAEDDLHPLDGGEMAQALADLRLRELLSSVCAGQGVDGMELLDCLGLAGEDNWASLGLGTFGPKDWWPSLLAAVEEAAVGGNQQRRDRDVMAFFLLVQNDLAARKEAVAGVLQVQQAADEAAFSAALAEFSSKEQDVLNGILSK